MAPPPEKTAAVVDKATREGVGTRREDGVFGCIPRRVWSFCWRNRKRREDPIPYPKRKLPPTLAYRGTRVGEAKNPGPTEDLDIEILGGTGSGAESEAEGRSRTPPRTAATRTGQKGKRRKKRPATPPCTTSPHKEKGKRKRKPTTDGDPGRQVQKGPTRFQ